MRGGGAGALPEGATWIIREGDGAPVEEVVFCLLSRGDRVWGRCARPRNLPGAAAGVILLPPDGRADGGWARAALSCWGGRMTVAALDLPLCGRRRSDKLSAPGLDPRAPLGSRLADDVACQLRSDLCGLERLLAQVVGIDASRTAIVALGLGATLLRPTPDDSWTSMVLGGGSSWAAPAPLGRHVRTVELPCDEERDPWLDELGAYLLAALDDARS